MTLEQHFRRLQLLCHKFAGGAYNSGLTDCMMRIPTLPAQQEDELVDLEALIKIEGKKWL